MFSVLFFIKDLEFEQYAENNVCDGTNDEKGYLASPPECANSCKGSTPATTVFSFGNANVTEKICGGKECCKNGKCICVCEQGAKADGTCKITPKGGYHLYRLVLPGNAGKNIQVKCISKISF